MLLKAENLHFSYGQRPALRGVSLSMSAGQVVALIGPNGSGKSTLIKVLLGVLHGQGEIAWEGRAIGDWARRELARRVAYLPQSPTWQDDQRVMDVLHMGRAPYQHAFGLETEHDAQVVQRVSAMLELDELLERPMDELSGGQRQRVFVGRCLVQEPAALLLDEPNTYLDLKHQVELCSLLLKLSRENQFAVLMASHDLNLAAAFADQVMVLQEGKIVASGRPQEVMQAEMLSAVYGLKLERLDRPGENAPVVLPKL